MRTVWRAVVAVQLALAHPLLAQDSSTGSHSISEKLPLFSQNHCEIHKDPANQLFCADPELIAAGAKLAAAIQERLNRLPDRLLAVEENAEWIRNRNQSCGIFGHEAIRVENIEPVTACLLTETEERTDILRDPNFDCLAVNTAAGALICSDPSLAEAELDLNKDALKLIGKLNETDAKDAFTEFARWTRDRDRKCNLAGKENMPLSELSASQDCLAATMKQREAEIAAAKGDPKKLFGRHLPSPLPNADAVDMCVAQIHAANACGDFVRVSRVIEKSSETSDQSAQVTAEVEMIVLSPFAACSPVASSCTGTCWDIKSGKAKPTPRNRDSFPVSNRIRIEKAFALVKADKDGWRCNTTALPPVELGVTLGPN
ncbi:MAG: hypothetical protein JO141_30070 [Bradyrhizobium sp.]|nr:hypothetical protein [Bradyrhizobium sp.]